MPRNNPFNELPARVASNRAANAMLQEAERRGHPARSTGAAVCAGLGALVGSFGGPGGALVGGGVGALVGAIIGDACDQGGGR